MADEPIDTEKLRGLVEMATQMDGDCSGSVVAADIVLAQAGGLLDEIERLRAENQRLREELADETRKCSDLWDEAETVLRLMDGLAEQWGDEAVFRRCRDRLRAAVEAAQEASE